MLFWVVIIVLLAISIFLIYQCVVAVRNQFGNDDYDSEDYDQTRRRRASDGGARLARGRRDDYDDESDYDYDDDYDGASVRRERGDDYDDDYDGAPARRGRGGDYDDDYDGASVRRGRGDYDDEPERVRRVAPAQKQFRILMQNLDTWDKYTYQFYEAIGIGRAKDDPEFEQFLTIEGDPKVSKHHCAIVSKAGKLYLEDLGSTNGTFLNEERLTDTVLIQKEDVIRIGETQIEVKKILRERD